MEKFLNLVVKDILTKEKQDLSNVLVLFPNNRAKRFFVEEIKNSGIVSMPCFIPEIMSIIDLTEKYIFDYKQAEKLQLLYILYNVYTEVYYGKNPELDKNKKESFADFYRWGDMILNDFDEVDKSLVDVKSFYRNLKDYKDLEQDPEGFLSKDAIQLINQMFNSNLLGEGVEIRKNFIKVWNCLFEIYDKFNKKLDCMHWAYSGKMYRLFAKRLENDEIKIEQNKIKIIGFSVLNKSEKKIFELLKEKYTTDFYWDYDNYYKDDKQNEAGIFVNENLNLFNHNKEFAANDFNNIIETKKQINIISSPYETTSLAYIAQWLDEVVTDCEKERISLNNIAIILNDESIIPLVLKSIPAQYKDKINITMGYPFKQSWLLNELIEKINNLIEQDKFTKQEVYNTIQSIADTFIDNEKEKLWQIEILKKVFNLVSSFIDTIESLNNNTNDNPITKEIIKDVIYKDFSKLNIDIVSDGVKDIQLMGMLETRTLDFQYILMLSTTDDNLPKMTREVSFIPFSFRKAYEMNNVERKTGVFAYYFYRLLHRVKRIDYVYTTASSATKIKEISRFVRQVEIELQKQKNNLIINKKHLLATNALKNEQRYYEFHFSDLKFLNKGKSYLSPSSLNKLIHCEQQFYLNKIKVITEEIEDKDYLAIAFGNIFHNSANILYSTIADKYGFPIGTHIDDKELKQIINSSVETYINDENNLKEKRICGDKIHLAMIREYLFNVVNLDKKEKNIYLCGEMELKHDIKIGNNIVHLSGRLDRMDLQKDTQTNKYNLRIIDYKTGKDKKKKISSLEDIFSNKQISDNKKSIKPRKEGMENIFEILFYCYMLYSQTNEVIKNIKPALDKANISEYMVDTMKIKPELMYLSKPKDRNIELKGSGILYYDSLLNTEFEDDLKKLLSNFINKQEKDKYKTYISEDICRYCDYKLLCSLGK